MRRRWTEARKWTAGAAMAALLAIAAPAGAEPPLPLLEARLGQHPGLTRIVFDLDDNVAGDARVSADGTAVQIQLARAHQALGASPGHLGLAKRVTLGGGPGDMVSILVVAPPGAWRAFELPPQGAKRRRLVVDLSPTPGGPANSPAGSEWTPFTPGAFIKVKPLEDGASPGSSLAPPAPQITAAPPPPLPAPAPKPTPQIAAAPPTPTPTPAVVPAPPPVVQAQPTPPPPRPSAAPAPIRIVETPELVPVIPPPQPITPAPAGGPTPNAASRPIAGAPQGVRSVAAPNVGADGNVAAMLSDAGEFFAPPKPRTAIELIPPAARKPVGAAAGSGGAPAFPPALTAPQIAAAPQAKAVEAPKPDAPKDPVKTEPTRPPLGPIAIPTIGLSADAAPEPTPAPAPAVKPVALPLAADPPRSEPVKTEPVKAEPAKVEPPKPEPVKTEAAKPEPTKAAPAQLAQAPAAPPAAAPSGSQAWRSAAPNAATPPAPPAPGDMTVSLSTGRAAPTPAGANAAPNAAPIGPTAMLGAPLGGLPPAPPKPSPGPPPPSPAQTPDSRYLPSQPAAPKAAEKGALTECRLPGVRGLGVEAQAVTLEDAIVAALSRSNVLKQREYGADAAKATREQAAAGLYPRVDVSAQTGVSTSGDSNSSSSSSKKNAVVDRLEGGLTISQMLWDFNSTLDRMAAEQQRLEAAKDRVAATRHDVVYRTVQAYLDLLLQAELCQNTVWMRERLLVYRNRAHKLLDERIIPPRIAYLLDNRYTQAGIQVLQMARRIEDAHTELKRLTGIDNPVLATPPQRGLPFTDLDSILETAATRAPALLELRKRERAYGLERSAAEATRYGRVDANAAAKFGRNVDGSSGQDHSMAGLLTYRASLYDGGMTGATERERAARSMETRSEMLELENSLKSTLTQAWTVLRSSIALQKTTNDNIRAQEKLLDIYEREMQEGTGDLIQMLDTIQSLTASRNLFVSSRYGQLSAAYAILKETGMIEERP